MTGQAGQSKETKPSSLSFDEAVARLKGGPKGSPAAANPAKQAEPTPEPQPDSLEPDETNLSEESDAGGSVGDDHLEAGEGEGADETYDPSKDPLVEVTVNGEVVEVALSELIASYSKGSDYTNKTKALAEHRRAVEQQATEVKALRDELAAERTTVQQARERYEAGLTALQNVMEEPDAEWAKIDWDRLDEEDPIEANKLWRKYQQHQQRKEAVAREAKRLAEEKQAEARKERDEAVKALRGRITEALPHWSDENVRNAEWGAMYKSARELGFTDAEINATTDPRIFLLLHKAALADRAKKAGATPAPNRVPGRDGGQQKLPAKVVQPSGARPVIRAGGTGGGVSVKDALDAFRNAARKGGGNALDAGAQLLRAHRQQLARGSARR